MPWILLKTSLNGPDNQGGAPYGVPGAQLLVDDAVAKDAVARGFADAIEGDYASTDQDQFAALHTDPVTARYNADAAQRAADEAVVRAKRAQVEADNAAALAKDARALADAADKASDKDTKAKSSPTPATSASSSSSPAASSSSSSKTS
jgi:hypothetical protein